MREKRPADAGAPEYRRGDVVLAGLVLVVTAGTLTAAVPLVAPLGFHLPSDVWGLVVAAVLSCVGAAIVLRRPGNVVGRMLCVAGISWAILIGGSAYAAPAAVGVVRPGVALVGWIVTWSWIPPFVTLFFLLPLLIPDGRLPSRRWRGILIAGLGVAVILAVGTMVAPGPLELGADVLPIDNPFGVARAAPVLDALDAPVAALLLAMPVTGAAAVLVRYRRGDLVTRQQLKWLLYATGLLTAVFAVGQAVEVVLDLLMPLPFAFVPAAVGIAVLRHRLYDIDRLISRTLSYGLLTGLLGATYMGGVFTLQQVLRPLSGDSEWATAGATLVVAALFQPARRTIQAAVDRRFNRVRYDRELTVRAFQAQLRREVNVDALGADLVGTVRSTMDPVAVSLWLRPSGPTGEAQALIGQPPARRS